MKRESGMSISSFAALAIILIIVVMAIIGSAPNVTWPKG